MGTAIDLLSYFILFSGIRRITWYFFSSFL
jgi:hypothetical protein